MTQLVVAITILFFNTMVAAALDNIGFKCAWAYFCYGVLTGALFAAMAVNSLTKGA